MCAALTDSEMTELLAARPTTSSEWARAVDKIKAARIDENGETHYPRDWFSRVLCDSETFQRKRRLRLDFCMKAESLIDGKRSR